MARTPYIPQPKPAFPYERPLSWSQISSFTYNPRQWYEKYVLNEEQPTSKEMLFGKEVGERLASDPTFLPQVERLPIFEHELKFEFQGIPMIGYMDTYLPHSKMREYKTGRKKWDQQRANNHGQVDLYLLGTYILEKVRPEDMTCHIDWLPTHIHEGKVALIEPVVVHTFKADRTMADVLRFGQRIIEVRKEMEEYYENYVSKDISEEDFFPLAKEK